MIYDFLGKKMTEKEVRDEIKYNPKLTEGSNIEHVYKSLRIQQKIEAERRITEETDPHKKRIMEEMYAHREYNFDLIFGN